MTGAAGNGLFERGATSQECAIKNQSKPADWLRKVERVCFFFFLSKILPLKVYMRTEATEKGTPKTRRVTCQRATVAIG